MRSPAPQGREEMFVRTLMRVGLYICSLAFGGVGVFFLWASFFVPQAAVHALFSLVTAVAILFALLKTA